MEPMRNPEEYHRGRCPVPTPTEREHVAVLIRKARVALAIAHLTVEERCAKVSA